MCSCEVVAGNYIRAPVCSCEVVAGNYIRAPVCSCEVVAGNYIRAPVCSCEVVAGNYNGYSDVAFVQDSLQSVPLLSANIVKLTLQLCISGHQHCQNSLLSCQLHVVGS